MATVVMEVLVTTAEAVVEEDGTSTTMLEVTSVAEVEVDLLTSAVFQVHPLIQIVLLK